MGILKHLLFWPVTGPAFLTRFSLEKVSDSVREELTSDDAVKEDLLALQMRLELGEIDDEEYVIEEAALMERLREVRRWREEYGMGIAGGPVRVAADSSERLDTTTDSPGGAGGVEEGADRGGRRGGIASPDGARVEVNFDWE